VEQIGTLRLLRRYPFKSMAGEDLAEVFVTYTGLVGDRAYAFVDRNNHTNFPWMTARQAREMILFRPQLLAPPSVADEHPARENFRAEVTTPEGLVLDLADPQFTPYFEKRFGRSLELRFSERAMQDACPLSLLGLDTIRSLAEEAGMTLDHRRFRSNFYVDWASGRPFFEDELVGARLCVGEKLTLMIVKKDSRCVIITLDPESGESSPKVLEAVARNHASCFGVYGSVLREGVVRAGDSVFLG
jgi:MOSC domain-containing protein